MQKTKQKKKPVGWDERPYFFKIVPKEMHRALMCLRNCPVRSALLYRWKTYFTLKNEQHKGTELKLR